MWFQTYLFAIVVHLFSSLVLQFTMFITFHSLEDFQQGVLLNIWATNWINQSPLSSHVRCSGFGATCHRLQPISMEHHHYHQHHCNLPHCSRLWRWWTACTCTGSVFFNENSRKQMFKCFVFKEELCNFKKLSGVFYICFVVTNKHFYICFFSL